MEPVLTLGGMSGLGVLAIIILSIIAVPLGVVAVVYLIVPFFKAIGWLIRQVAVFIFSMVADALRLIGAVITSIVLIPLTLGNVIIGRWSASAHYGRAIQAEFKNMGRCTYRLVVGNIARLLCLTALTDGIEKRIPEVMAAAPGADRPSRRLGQFEGYEIVGSLPGGGSGGRLYVAKPDAQKLASFARNGHAQVDHVVIKCFSQHDGTTLPQIVRENRALDAAKKLGLILEHDLNNERFYYAMRYVPGDSLNLVTQRLHAASGGNGLARREMHEILSYASDLLLTLRSYHDGGLWHKDVKPDNVIVCDGRAHLVDFGLVTPLRSSMTLTTHGTEYFRDPEMVRMALKGVKVHEVDGAKFDIYAVGAVIFSMVENSFPAHGGLSQITRPCPEAVRWIVRRAMTDYDKRYQSAAAMLADIHTVLNASDPFALRPAHLPSVAANADHHETPAAPVPPPIPQPVPAHAAPYPSPAANDPWTQYPGMNPNMAGTGMNAPGMAREGGRVKPELRVTSWMSGRYSLAGSGHGAAPYPGVGPAAAAAVAAAAAAAAIPHDARRTPRIHPSARASAGEQLRNARERAAAARQRVQNRIHGRSQNFPAGVNAGVVAAVLIFMGVCAFILFATLSSVRTVRTVAMAPSPIPNGSPVPELPVVIDTVIAGDATVHHASSDADFADGSRLLVVCEWSKFDQKRRDILTSQINSLCEAGFVLVGNYLPAQYLPEVPGNIHTETVAEFHTAVGTRPFLSASARDAARSWLDEEHKADAVLWFAPSEPGKFNKPATAWVIGGSSADGDIVKSTESVLKYVQ